MRILFAALILSFLGCQKSDPVIARVGGQTVRGSAFTKAVQGVTLSSQEYLRTPAGRKELLELLIRRKIILQEALDLPAEKQAGLPERLGRLKAGYEAQRRELKESYLQERDIAMVGHYLQTLRESTLKVTDADVRAFWDKESEVRGSHILVSDRAKADDIRARIAKGENFETLAKSHSEDVGTGRGGGDLGYLLKGSLVPEFEKVLFALAPGEISPPTPTPYGFHIIKRTGERPLKNFPFDDAMKARLRKALEADKLQAWFDQTRKRHSVRIDEEALQDLVFTQAAPPAPSTGTARGRP